jgi:hypothetical protein
VVGRPSARSTVSDEGRIWSASAETIQSLRDKPSSRPSRFLTEPLQPRNPRRRTISANTKEIDAILKGVVPNPHCSSLECSPADRSNCPPDAKQVHITVCEGANWFPTDTVNRDYPRGRLPQTFQGLWKALDVCSCHQPAVSHE